MKNWKIPNTNFNKMERSGEHIIKLIVGGVISPAPPPAKNKTSNKWIEKNRPNYLEVLNLWVMIPTGITYLRYPAY